MAGAKGFEPLNAWTKTRCLTAWRRPIAVVLKQSTWLRVYIFYRGGRRKIKCLFMNS